MDYTKIHFNKLNIDKALIKLNNLVRNNNILQDIILDKGIGRKYWKTIIPFTKTNDVLEKNLEFPKKVQFSRRILYVLLRFLWKKSKCKISY